MVDADKFEQNKKDNIRDVPNIIRGAMNDDLDAIKVCLERDPGCINEVDEDTGVTALHIAVVDGNFELADFLCSQPGIDCEVADYFGRYPAQIALLQDRPDIYEVVSRNLEKRLREKIAAEDAEDEARKAGVIRFIPPKPRSP